MSRCKVCNVRVTDEILSKKYCDPAYPDIHVGPYCSDCIGKIRICSGCHYPHVADSTCKYFGNGNWYCDTCQESISSCDQCGNESTIYKEYGGTKYCESCFKKHFRHCSRCNTTKNKSDFVTDSLIRKQYKGLFKVSPDCCQDCFQSNKSRYKKYEVHECQRCQSHFSGDNNGQHRYCKRCWDRIPECGSCGARDHLTKSYPVDRTVNGGKHICSKCKIALKKCHICGRLTKNNKGLKGRFSTIHMCAECNDENYQECPSCLRFATIRPGKKHCSSCLSTYFNNKCSDCGRIKDHNGSCRVCDSTNIYNYSHKPHTHFWFTAKDVKFKDGIFMGIENEITFPSSSKRDAALSKLYSTFDPDALCAKSDGSIDGYGFEIVTQPFSLAALHATDLSGMFFDSQDSSRSCGMHVHVGRSSFLSDLHIFKVVEFVHNQEKLINKVAGRKYNGYNSKFSKKPSSTVKDSKAGRAARSCRVNLTNGTTIEFRMFQGCTKEFELRYRAEFVHALVAWTTGIAVSRIHPVYFYEFVVKQQDKYPNLLRFLDRNCKQLVTV